MEYRREYIVGGFIWFGVLEKIFFKGISRGMSWRWGGRYVLYVFNGFGVERILVRLRFGERE